MSRGDAHPFPVHSLHGAEELLELLDRDAVAGQHAQHLDQQVCNNESIHINERLQKMVSAASAKNSLLFIMIIFEREVSKSSASVAASTYLLLLRY